MSVVKVIEITASSPDGFEAAVRTGIEKASETVRNIKAAWVSEQSVVVDGSTVTEYRVTMRISFVLD